MPWSPIPKFPDIIQDLKACGYAKECSFETLKTSIMRVLGLIGDKTISNTIKAMQRLGYVRMKPNGVTWEIYQGKLYQFASTGDENLGKYGV